MTAALTGDEAYNRQLLAAQQFILNHDQFLIVSHIQPDGDAISSTCAVGYMLEQLNKSYTMINEGSVPHKLLHLWGSRRIGDFSKLTESDSSAEENRTFKHVIAIDCADFSRIGKVNSWFAQDVQLLNIDHHPTNDDYGAVNVVNSAAAATVEILHDLAERLHITWSKELADCIYTGLLTDTGGFRYSNTSPKVMNIAAKMLAYGADGPGLANELLEKTTRSHIDLLQRALQSLQFADNGKLAWVRVTAADMEQSGATDEDFDGIVNYPRNIEGVEVGMLFKEAGPNAVKVGLRSNGAVDVAAIAKQLGGGGHVRAAGVKLSGTVDDVASQVVAIVRSVIHDQQQQ